MLSNFVQDKPLAALKRLRTAFVVVVITLLIWLAADRNVATTEEFQFRVRLTTSEPDRYVGFARPPYELPLTVELKGRRGRLLEFQKLIDGQRAFTINLGDTRKTSTQPIAISTQDDLIPRIRDLQDLRLSVVSVTPRTVDVRIDRYETRPDIPVRVDAGDLKITLDEQPQKIAVRAPRFVLNLPQFSASPQAVVNAGPAINAARTADGTFDVTAAVRLDFLPELDPNMEIVFLPSREVRIKGKISATTETRSKSPVQIRWSIPDEVQRDYVVVTDETRFRVQIDVTGPRGRVDQLDAENIRGWIDVLAGDVDTPGPGKDIIRDAVFMLPPEFSDCYISPTSPPIQFRFRLEPRSNPGASAQGIP